MGAIPPIGRWATTPFVGKVRGQGLIAAVEHVADRATDRPLPKSPSYPPHLGGSPAAPLCCDGQWKARGGRAGEAT